MGLDSRITVHKSISIFYSVLLLATHAHAAV